MDAPGSGARLNAISATRLSPLSPPSSFAPMARRLPVRLRRLSARHEFVRFPAVLATRESGCYEAVNAFVDKVGCGIKCIKRVDSLCRTAGPFHEHMAGAIQR